jgi:lipopolysaccharide transport protein LptA
MDENRQELMEVGADDFLSKPFREAELFQKIHAHVGVEYAYAEQPADAPREAVSALTSASLAGWPKGVIGPMRDAVVTADLDQLLIRIQAAEARFEGGLNFENSHWTISGDVRINADGGSLRSDKAVVLFRNKLISRATITGAPAEFEQLRDDGTTSRGHANTIDYETSSGTVSFSGNAWLIVGRNEISSQQLVYNIKTQSMQNNSKSGGGGSTSGRVRIVIQPGKPPVVTTPDKEKKP